jgi:hypothetical protein
MTRKSAEIASELMRTVGKSFSCFPSVEGGWRIQVWDQDGAHTFRRLAEVRAYVQALTEEAARQEMIERVIGENSRPRRKATKVNGQYVIGRNARNEALCIFWQEGRLGEVDSTSLRAIYKEARALGLKGPIHVYGATSLIGETESYHFTQVAA